jgi:hypothetical protein
MANAPPYKPPQISDRLMRLLRRGNDGTYASDFDYEWSIALGAVNAGKGEEWLRKVLKDRGPHLLRDTLDEDDGGTLDGDEQGLLVTIIVSPSSR